MSVDRSYVEQNTRQRERLIALVTRLGDDGLRTSVNEWWTVAGVLGHIAFWDGRVLALAGKHERGRVAHRGRARGTPHTLGSHPRTPIRAER